MIAITFLQSIHIAETTHICNAMAIKHKKSEDMFQKTDRTWMFLATCEKLIYRRNIKAIFLFLLNIL